VGWFGVCELSAGIDIWGSFGSQLYSFLQELELLERVKGCYVPALIRLATPARNVCCCGGGAGLKCERPLYLKQGQSRDRSDQHDAGCYAVRFFGSSLFYLFMS
jgi:hypothetical protein